MPAFTLTIDVKNGSNLALLEAEMTFPEKAEFAQRLAGDVEQLTRGHIATAAQTRHTTAEKLGATPTNYLLKRASSVEAESSPGRVLLSVSGEIFKRTFQSVKVSAVNAKMLTIPWSAEAYGKRAGEFGKLFVFVSKRGSGAAFLARREGRAMKFLFLLKRSVILSQDRGLLPSEADIIHTVEEAADDELVLITQRLEASA